MLKKSIVLTSLEGEEKAVLTIEQQGVVGGRLRLYNFNEEPRGIISLGLYSNGNVLKAGLTRVGSMLYEFKLQGEVPSTFSCAVVNFYNGQMKPLLYGTEGEKRNEEILGQVFNSLRGATSMSDVEQKLDDYGVDFDEETKKEIDETIDKNMGCEKGCENCKYRKYYFENINSSVEMLDEKDKSDIIIPDKKSFYDEISNQVEELFEKNPNEDYLQEIFPNSKWVRVEFDKGGDYYVFGLIYNCRGIRFGSRLTKITQKGLDIG